MYLLVNFMQEFTIRYLLCMRHISNLIVGILLFVSSVHAQVMDTALYQKYKLAQNTFHRFEKEHRGTVQGANHRISYLRWGSNTDKVFVWLPGSLLSAYDFYPFAESLVKAGYCVLSVDHYGHGLTTIPDRDLDFWDFADDLAAVMDELQIKNAVVGGFSRGGYLATAFYDKYPDRVNALVLEDGGSVHFKSLFKQMDTAQIKSFFESLEPPIEVQRLLFDVYRSDFEIYKNIDQIDGSAQQWQIFGFIKHKDNNSFLYHGLNEYMNMQDSTHYVQVLNTPSKISRYASSIARVNPIATYRSLRVPILLIDAIGENDSFDAQEGNRQLKSLHPDLVQHQLFDCADHNVHFSCPEDFLKALKDFLIRL